MPLILAVLLAGCGGSGTPGTPGAPQSPGASISALPASTPAANLGSEVLTDMSQAAWTGQLNDQWHFNGSVTVARLSDNAQAGAMGSGSQLYTMPDSSPITPWEWYRCSMSAYRVSGTADNVQAWAYAGGSSQISYTAVPVTASSYQNYVYTIQPQGASLNFGFTTTVASGWSDEVAASAASIRQIPFPSLVSLKDSGSPYGKAQAMITMQAGTQAGIIFNADSATNPQNFLIVYHDGQNGIQFYKVTGGTTWTLVPAGGGDLANYGAAGNPQAAYSPGAALTVQRIPGTNAYTVYYNGNRIGTETVTDPAIVSNTVYGLFNTFEQNSVAFQYVPANAVRNIVYFGGSITNGSNATMARFNWQNRLAAWLDTNFLNISFNHILSAEGGTDSFNGLIRLQSEALAYNPAIIIVDQAVNDNELSSSDAGWPWLGEEIIRRIRSSSPATRIVVANFTQPSGSNATPTSNEAAVDNAWNRIATYYGCDLYRLDSAILAFLGTNATSEQIADAYFNMNTDCISNGYATGPFPASYCTGYQTGTNPTTSGVHPNNAGHALIAQGLEAILANPLAANDWSGNMADYPRIGTAQDYQYQPQILLGSDLQTRGTLSGTWTVNGTQLVSITAGSTVTYTGPMIMVGLDVVLEGGAWPTGLQYSLDGGAWTAVTPQNPSVWVSEFLALASPRSVHTLTLRLGSGTVSLNRLLIL